MPAAAAAPAATPAAAEPEEVRQPSFGFFLVS